MEGVRREERKGERARVGCVDARAFRVDRIRRVPGWFGWFSWLVV